MLRESASVRHRAKAAGLRTPGSRLVLELRAEGLGLLLAEKVVMRLRGREEASRLVLDRHQGDWL